MILLDRLRPPAPFDPTAPAYKDWLHVNLVDHRSGAVGLVNCSLHGAPSDPRARAVAAALVDVPGVGWAGNVAVRDLDRAQLRPGGVAVDVAALAVDHAAGSVEASAHLRDDALSLRLSARAEAPATAVEERLPFGDGWISWYVVPRLAVTGHLAVGEARLDLAGASAYHDHNWGRWHWGDDVAWDWGCFLAPAPGPAVVVARTADRSRRRLGPPFVVVQAEGRRRTYRGAAVTLERSGHHPGLLRRVPGAMAALRSDRAAPRLPAAVIVAVDDGRDRLRLRFSVRAAAQLVLADPVTGRHSFLHELSGEFVCDGRVAGSDVGDRGLGVVEILD